VHHHEPVRSWGKEAAGAGKAAGSTLKAYGHSVRKLVAFLGHDDAARVTPENVVALKDALLAELNPRNGKPVSAKTVNHGDLAGLKTVFAWAVKNRKLGSNPATGITVAVAMRMRTKGFTEVEALAILQALPRNTRWNKEPGQSVIVARDLKEDQMRCSLLKSAAVIAAVSVLAVVPLWPSGHGPAVAWAANGNGNAGGNGNGNAGGNGNGNGQGDNGNGNANGQGDSAGHVNNGHANGQGGIDQAPGQDAGNRPATAVARTNPASGDPLLAPSRLGRLNAFFHASPSAQRNASAHSAVGAISKIYDHVMLSYLNNSGATLDDVAAALARAANKPLNPSVVAAINARLNVYAGIDPTQVDGGYASTADINLAVTSAANASFAAKSSQGLGSN
jgi:hypothetical protein